MSDETPTFVPPVADIPTNDVRIILGLLTEDEFGRAVGVVGSTVAIWRNRGEGPPFYRFKRNIFYRTADIIQWIIENTWDPASEELVAPKPGLPFTFSEKKLTPKINADGNIEYVEESPKSTQPQAVPDDEPEAPATSAV